MLIELYDCLLNYQALINHHSSWANSLRGQMTGQVASSSVPAPANFSYDSSRGSISTDSALSYFPDLEACRATHVV